jgi:hypothetical protein
MRFRHPEGEALLACPENKELVLMPLNQEQMDYWGNALDEKIRKLAREEEDKDSINGFFSCYDAFIDGLVKRTQTRQDAVVAVSGERGIGKSTFSMVTSLVLNNRIPKGPLPTFSWNNICFKYDTIGELVEKAGAESTQVYNIDEAIDVAHAKQAMSRLNIELSKFIQKARKNNNIYFWCIPDFKGLDSEIRNTAIHFWVHVFYRTDNPERKRNMAFAAFFKPDMSPFNPDKWGLIEGKKDKEPAYDVESLIAIFRRRRQFRSILSYPMMPQIIEETYELQSKDALKKTGEEFRANYPRGKKLGKVAPQSETGQENQSQPTINKV